MILGPGLALAPGCNLRSLALVAVTCDADLLHRAIKANARSLRHLYFDSMYVENQSILRLAKLHTLQLDTLQIVDECAYTYCQSALVRYVNGERPSEDPFKQIPCHKTPLSKRNACSCWAEQVYDEIDPDDGPPRIVTKSQIYIDSDSDSNVDSEGSVGPSDDSRHAPKWAWARFFDKSLCSPAVFFWQVPDSHPKGHVTEIWKFISRSGELAHGKEPLEWFEDWDPEEGDVAEPTPYCRALREFCKDNRPRPGELGYWGFGPGEYLKAPKEPPEGAMQYSRDEDPAANEYRIGYVDRPKNMRHSLN